ncbi:MAG: hypothetical protein O3C28_18480, partial [Proteobacteria bacterium]|nr:hypothetical protein [Pseudomonadota bacterium]
MRTAISHLKSTSCYSQSKHVPIPKPKDRSFEEHEKAIWRERIHCDADGNVFIPPNCFKSAIMAASNYRQRKIPGAGNATFTKHFKSGLICMTPML